MTPLHLHSQDFEPSHALANPAQQPVVTAQRPAGPEASPQHPQPDTPTPQCPHSPTLTRSTLTRSPFGPSFSTDSSSLTSFSIISWPKGFESPFPPPATPPLAPSPSSLPLFLSAIQIYNPSFPFRSTLSLGTLFLACIIPSQLFSVYFKHFGGLSLDGNLINCGVCGTGTIAAERGGEISRDRFGGREVGVRVCISSMPGSLPHTSASPSQENAPMEEGC